MLDPRRLERYLRASMQAQTRATRVGPFTLYYHAEGAYPALNLAMPEEQSEGRRVPVLGQEAAGLGAVPDEDPEYALMMLEAQFRARKRVPRVECIAECHPDLPERLEKAGFREESRVPLLVCTRASWKRIDDVPELRVDAVLPTSPWETLRDHLHVQKEAFQLDIPLPAAAPKDPWSPLGIGAGVLALLSDKPVGTGGFTLPQDGIAEIRGLAVVPDARRQGIGAFLLSALARVAHEGGIEAVLATPDGPSTARLARRAGFVPVATLVAFTTEDAAAP